VNPALKRLLIVGQGDIARRALPRLGTAFEIRALTRTGGMDLDRPESLVPLEHADVVLHCVPPPQQGREDTRTANLLAMLDCHAILPTRLVYVGTSGVYGDCGGAWINEERAPRPQTPRAVRRLDAESRLALWCAARDVALVILRAPGIYAADRLPLARLRDRTPVLRPEDDVYTNHIHAEDLAACCVRALEADAPAGVYNASDDSSIKMGDWMDLVADHAGLPRPRRVARTDAATAIPAALLSFMGESRRLDNSRLKQTLGVRLRYPTVQEGLHDCLAGHHQPA
jgi:nucleoside-diphosphate-sugar epimerase